MTHNADGAAQERERIARKYPNIDAASRGCISGIENWPGVVSEAREVLDAITLLGTAPSGEPDVRRIVEALGFDPTNHHNAAKCPYCTDAGAAPAEREGRGPNDEWWADYEDLVNDLVSAAQAWVRRAAERNDIDSAEQVLENHVRVLAAAPRDAYAAGYSRGHNDTVEGCVVDAGLAADEYLNPEGANHAD